MTGRTEPPPSSTSTSTSTAHEHAGDGPPVDQPVSGGAGVGVHAVSDPQLDAYRASIDNIDAALVHLLAERFKITKAVGRYKASAALPPADPERERVQIARLRALAESAGLDPAFTEEFLRFIVAEVIHHHRRIAEGENL